MRSNMKDIKEYIGSMEQLCGITSYVFDEGRAKGVKAFDVDNGHQCVIHTGGQYASYLQIPFIPPKYQSGDYIYEG